jgi:hypothetical protein
MYDGTPRPDFIAWGLYVVRRLAEFQSFLHLCVGNARIVDQTRRNGA